MSERFDRWCMVMGGQVQGAYADRKQADERAKIIGADVIRLVELRDGESITGNDETARAFKVGDRVRLLPSCVNDHIHERYIGATATIERSAEAFDFKLSLDNDQGSWCVNKENIEPLTPANPPMAPWSLVDDARKERDAAIERAEKAEANADFLRRSIGECHMMISRGKSEFQIEKDWKPCDLPSRLAEVMRRALAAEAALNDERKRYRDDTAAKLLAAEYADSNAALPAGMTTDQYWINRAKWALIVAQHLADAAFGFPPEKEVKG